MFCNSSAELHFLSSFLPRSLQYLAVSLVTIFKNLTNIIILAGDWYFFGATASKMIIFSLCLVLLGAVCAGAEDIAFSFTGYVWMALNCFATAGYGAATFAPCLSYFREALLFMLSACLCAFLLLCG